MDFLERNEKKATRARYLERNKKKKVTALNERTNKKIMLMETVFWWPEYCAARILCYYKWKKKRFANRKSKMVNLYLLLSNFPDDWALVDPIFRHVESCRVVFMWLTIIYAHSVFKLLLEIPDTREVFSNCSKLMVWTCAGFFRARRVELL